MPSPLVGWRYGVVVGGLVGAIGLAIYPIIIAPYRNPGPYRQMANEARASKNIRQEDIQPGNMKVWTDPFDRQGKPGHK